MEVIPFKDKEYINSIYNTDFIKKRSSFDCVELKYLESPHVIYLKAMDGNKSYGFFVVGISYPDYEIHACLEYNAIVKSREFGRLALQWVFEHGAKRVTAPVSFKTKSVINYCLKLGFKLEGVKRLSSLQNGVFYNEAIMGILKEEFYEFHYKTHK